MAEAGRVQPIGSPVSDFSLQRIGGGVETLEQYAENKRGVVVIFWSGVCSHCGRYDDYLNRFASRYPELGFVCLASRQNETKEMIGATAETRKLTFPILHDPDSGVAGRWFAQQTPRAYLLDAKLTLLYRGAIDNFMFPHEPEYVQYLEPAIEHFLAGKPVPRAETPSFGCDIRSVYYILPKSI
ncbi:MAG: redoxin domain-containing protein [Bryobacteraceae bacterium]